jgi:hypothetical protein
MSMASGFESYTSSAPQGLSVQSSGWLKVGLAAAASALAGGLAAAWWYRKTFKTLRQTGETTPNPHFGISADDPSNG